jgi:hypothetical protein
LAKERPINWWLNNWDNQAQSLHGLVFHEGTLSIIFAMVVIFLIIEHITLVVGG